MAQPDASISHLRLISDSEQAQLLAGLNAGWKGHSKGASINRLFEKWAERMPQATAITYGGEKLTYAELNEKANK